VIAREKLELKLADMQADRLINNFNYITNDYDYLTEELEKEGFKVEENIVTVNEYKFEIDRSVPKIKGDIVGKEETPKEPTGPTIVGDLIGKPASTTNTYAEEKYGNKIVIPAGFTVVPNGTDGVVYDYVEENGVATGEPVVQDGIVIEDGEGNQFVWIPVGTINNKADDEKGETTEIKLGRYSSFTMGTNNTPPTPTQEATVEGYDTATIIDNYFFENMSGEYDGTTYSGNTKTIDLQGWIRTTLANKGYYIARYEASYGTDGKANSKPSEGTPSNSNGSAPTTEGMLWNWITQPNAATAARKMYPKSTDESVVDEYYSDLCNSYAWDTAIIFIQAYSGNNTYANKTPTYTDTSSPYQPANTGERGTDSTIGANTTDKVCNIYDMASNAYEWTTETSASLETPCVSRGCGFYSTSTYVKGRGSVKNTHSVYASSFRTLIYVNNIAK